MESNSNKLAAKIIELVMNSKNDNLLLEVVKLLSEKQSTSTKVILDNSLFDKWISTMTLANNSIVAYKSKWSMFMKWMNKNNMKYVSDITDDIAIAYVADVFKKMSGRYDIAVLKRFWSDMLPTLHNPWSQKIKLRPAMPSKCHSHRVLSKREMRRIDTLMQATSISNSNDLMSELIDAIAFAKTYGMRISSIANLKTSDFAYWKRKNCFLHVPEKTKRLKPIPLELPFIDNIKNIVSRRYDKHNDFLLQRFHDRYYSKGDISKIFKRIFTKAKVRSTYMGVASFHSYRMTFITRMDEINAPVAVTDNITGHASQTMHNLYSRPSVAVKRKWLLKLQKTY